MSHQFKELSEGQLNELIDKQRKAQNAPITNWAALAGQLQEEGLIHRSTTSNFIGGSAASSSAGSNRITSRTKSIFRYASMFAVLAIGIAIGRYTDNGDSSSPAPAGEYADAPADDDAELVFASYESPEQALQVLQRSQLSYQQAAAYLSVKSDTSSFGTDDENLRIRLAALDIVVNAARNVLQGVPDDPILKQYYLSSSGARQATLQMLNRKLPDGSGLAGY